MWGKNRRVRVYGRRRSRRPKAWSKAEVAHYQTHKEAARSLTLVRLEYFNQHYQLTYNRVSIKNTRSRWGSCSAQQNLNFNYKIIFLPAELQDYLIVHELCHLKEMNHGPQFWALVAEMFPTYKQSIVQLRSLEPEYFSSEILSRNVSSKEYYK